MLFFYVFSDYELKILSTQKDLSGERYLFDVRCIRFGKLFDECQTKIVGISCKIGAILILHMLTIKCAICKNEPDSL